MEFNATNKMVPESAGLSETQFCMICLDTSTDCKLYPMGKSNWDMEFENLTGISLEDKLYFVPQFCTICAQRLSNSRKLRAMCLNAYQLLSGLVEINKLTIRTLRMSNNLTSSIGKRSFQPDHCDLYLIHKEQEPEVQELPHSKTIKIEIINANKIHIQNPLLRNEISSENEVLEYKTENVDDIQTDLVDSYSDDIENDDLDIDLDIDIDTDIDNHKTINDIVTEVKLLDTKLTLNADSNHVNNVEGKVVEIDDSDVEFKDDIHDGTHSDADIDIDTQGAERVKGVVDKFRNDVFLKDSESDSDSKKTENAKAIIVHKIKENNKRVRRKLVRKETENLETLEYLKHYKITDLTYEEQLTDIQKRKDKESFINSQYRCMTCFKGAANIDKYNEHMERHTDKYGKSVCLVCGLHFRSDISLRGHVANTHSVRYSCNTCPMVTNIRKAAKNHAALHKVTIYTKCPHCSKELRSKYQYLSHLRKDHPTTMACCALCGHSFVTERSLSTHLNFKHYGENLQNLDGPLCEYCNIRFASEKAYRQHLKVLCKRGDSGWRKLQWQKYYSFYSDTNTPRKLRSCEGYCLCDQCGKWFQSPGLLWEHSQVHTGEKLFKCAICHKAYMHKPSLRDHMLNTHSENPPRFPCGVCHREFSFAANRQRHMSTHQDTLYKCDICDKSFTSVFGVEQHVTHVHRNVPWPKRNRRDRPKPSKRRSRVTTSDEDKNTTHEESK
ncbi:zinc finger protein 761-like isoform X2 [Maniola jurtina]|uniref:zinc finger protein 761-like isoform X2 n=2 Tax=Maniola jurtina TaxID=191418 RepID=UPI001E68D3C5|nr:zinc finger protein 761-like isoform X2 [Maniola jurtina]XP_045783415.1 zinc finger protein 761-like isoform X2 [Maniola jurtina]XP_045783416.1 zinc finger protein 761-like isoform X2 [Maniola jurtina]XP_045783417.1 zinc finger protein 761-like isoform X2 [Maniola jurtina]